MASSKSEPLRRVAFLSQDDLSDYVCDDDVALPAFADAGLAVSTVSWHDAACDWSAFDAVIVRSTWDYQNHADAFFARLREIDDATRLANPLAMMRWNMDKRYLAGLSEQGVAVVPTAYGEGLDAERLDALIAGTNGEAVIKPVVSAGAERTYRVRADASDVERAAIVAAHADSRWMWQPFVASVVEEGEYSLMYFAGNYSHTIVKRPRAGDFRVQEEFGGRIAAVAVPDDGLVDVARRALATLDEAPLYARVDVVRGADGGWQLIELELIEPSLFLNRDAQASVRFAAAVDAWLASAR